MTSEQAIEFLKNEWLNAKQKGVSEKFLKAKGEAINVLIDTLQEQEWELLSSQMEFSKELERKNRTIEKLEGVLLACGINIPAAMRMPLEYITKLAQHASKLKLIYKFRIEDFLVKRWFNYYHPKQTKLIQNILDQNRAPTPTEVIQIFEPSTLPN